MPDSIEVRVARGAALLDEHAPDWWRRIDVGTLNLADGCRCVLGQVYGEYSVGCEALVEKLGIDELWTYWDDTPFGFMPAWDEREALDEAWIATIKDRWERLA